MKSRRDGCLILTRRSIPQLCQFTLYCHPEHSADSIATSMSLPRRFGGTPYGEDEGEDDNWIFLASPIDFRKGFLPPRRESSLPLRNSFLLSPRAQASALISSPTVGLLALWERIKVRVLRSAGILLALASPSDQTPNFASSPPPCHPEHSAANNYCNVDELTPALWRDPFRKG